MKDGMREGKSADEFFGTRDGHSARSAFALLSARAFRAV